MKRCAKVKVFSDKLSYLRKEQLAKLKKSLDLLCGECGNGKTTLVRAFQSLLNALHLQNTWRSETWGMQMQNARDIARLCKDNWREWQRLCRVPMLAIDDLGTEPMEVKDKNKVSREKLAAASALLGRCQGHSAPFKRKQDETVNLLNELF